MTRTRMGLVPGLLLALTLAVAACGSGGNSDGVASVGGKATATTSAGGGGDPQQAALAFARCMRQHGITNMPDPQFTGNRLVQDPPPGMELGDPKFKATEQACVQFLPAGKPRPQSGRGGR